MVDKYAARRHARQMKAVQAGMAIARQVGGLDVRESVEHVRIAALSSIAESRAVWAFLLERGIATEKQHQDYLDKGFDSVLAQIEGKAAEVMVVGKPS